jgi:hypothetical protein
MIGSRRRKSAERHCGLEAVGGVEARDAFRDRPPNVGTMDRIPGRDDELGSVVVSSTPRRQRRQLP